MDHSLRKIIQGVSNTHGKDFFNAITLEMSDVIGADYTFIAKLDIEAYQAHTISLVAKGALADNFSYSLESTPCANVADNSVCYYPRSVTNIFPEDQLLIDMNIEAYLGTPLHDSHGKVMGLIVALYENTIEDSDDTLTLFQIFSGRIAAELERNNYESQLLVLNKELENRVIERTEDLNRTLKSLKQTQDQLVESEKTAALGNVVASIAHEVNTPLGVAITGHSLIQDAFSSLAESVDGQSLTKKAMTDYQELMSDTLPLVTENLKRAKELINNFKKTAADQHSEIKDTINLFDYYSQVISTLLPMTKRESTTVTLSMPRDIEISTYPGVHGQILTNLISNSLFHAFEGIQERNIVITVEKSQDQYLVTYRDNGKGVNETQRKTIFEPFYTTARHEGGTGLGMSIVHSLVRQKLNGTIKLLSDTPGFGLQYSIPFQH